MLKSINGDFMKIHFTWINWCLENRKKVRKRISGATEEERIEIAKHEGLDNAFLIRRLKDVAFQNLIYYKILSDRDIYRKIMPKLTEILSKNVMYSEDIIELLKKDGLIVPFGYVKQDNSWPNQVKMNLQFYTESQVGKGFQTDSPCCILAIENYEVKE